MWGQPPSAVAPSAARRGSCGAESQTRPPSEARRACVARAPPPARSLLRPLRHRFSPRSRQLRLCPSRTLASQQPLQTSIRINRRCMILHQPAGIRRRPIVAVHLAPQHAQHGHQLPAMMRSVGHPPHHHPGPRPLHLKELRLSLPPRIILRLQRLQSLPAVLGISLHELQPCFGSRQRRRPHINSQHVPKPQILAHALMHHLLPHTPPPRIPAARPQPQDPDPGIRSTR